MTHFEVVAGSRFKDWPGQKPSREPSLEVHLARRQATVISRSIFQKQQQRIASHCLELV